MVEQEASTAAKSNAESQVRVDTLFVVLAGITEPQFFKTRERLLNFAHFLATKVATANEVLHFDVLLTPPSKQ